VSFYDKVLDACAVDTSTKPITCGATVDYTDADIQEAPKGVKAIAWLCNQASDACRSKCGHKGHPTSVANTMLRVITCSCSDPSSVNPPPHNIDA